MKVYAEFFEKNGRVYRLNTLLKFGDSWDLIGNVVLANPGSARPDTIVNADDFNLISQFYDRYRGGEKTDIDCWFEVVADPTMFRIEKIFSGWYVGREKKLSGVVQLFNTFNLVNQDLQEAILQVDMESSFVFSKHIYRFFNDKPTYFGFSRDVLANDTLREVAKNIFEKSSDTVKSFYEQEFNNNPFYHTSYVNRAYRQDSFRKYRDNVLSRFSE